MSVLTQKDLQQGVRDIDAEACGVLSVVIIQSVDAVMLLADALVGDHEALKLLDVVNRFCDQIGSAPKTKPILCLACPRPLLGSGYSIAIATAARDDPKKGITMGVCPRCATTRQGVLKTVSAHLKTIWPDLRTIQVTHPEGARA